MTALVRYEAARSALAEAHRIDEVKSIRDKAEAMAAYARQAKDTELIQYATEIKVRAERKCGEMLRESAERGERATGKEPGPGRGRKKASDDATPLTTLADLGITRDESSRYQKLANMPDDHFETAIDTAKATAGEVTTAFMLREADRQQSSASKSHKQRPGRKMSRRDKQRIEEMQEAQRRGISQLKTYAAMTLRWLQSQSEFSQEERDTLVALHTLLTARGFTQ